MRTWMTSLEWWVDLFSLCRIVLPCAFVAASVVVTDSVVLHLWAPTKPLHRSKHCETYWRINPKACVFSNWLKQNLSVWFFSAEKWSFILLANDVFCNPRSNKTNSFVRLCRYVFTFVEGSTTMPSVMSRGLKLPRSVSWVQLFWVYYIFLWVIWWTIEWKNIANKMKTAWGYRLAMPLAL